MSQDKIRTEAVDEMLKVFARMNDTDELYSLLQDLCTVREIADSAGDALRHEQHHDDDKQAVDQLLVAAKRLDHLRCDDEDH